MSDKQLLTRGGREKWQVEFDLQGRMKANWAEKVLTGTALVCYDKHAAEFESFQHEQLFQDAERLVFRAIKSLASEQMPVDTVTVCQRLTEWNQLQELPNGFHYLIELADQAEGWGSEHIGEWCRIIATNASLVKFRSELKELEQLALIGTDVDSLRERLSQLADVFPADRRRTETTMNDAVDSYIDRLADGQSETILCGIHDIDQAVGGFAPGEMFVIGGRPGSGKSLAEAQIIDSASRMGHAALVISEEMPVSTLAKRQLQRIMPTDVGGWASDLKRLRFEVRSHFEHRAPVIVAESCGTIAAAERAIAKAVRSHDIKFCAIDYCQLLKGDGANRYEQVSDVSTRMKRAATRYGLVVLLLAQLNRSLESRVGAIPQLSDLRDSGQLEQDADVVLFTYWPARIDPTYHDPTEYRIYQAKNRSRGIKQAVIKMRIRPERQLIESATAGESEHPAENW